MTERVLFRQDSYPANKRPVYRYEFVDADLLPMNLASCTVRATFKVVPTDPNTDPTDTDAAITADITFDEFGAVSGTPTSWALPSGMTAADGVLELVLTSDETMTLPLATQLLSDVQITDADGDISTLIMVGTLSARDGFTNRT